MIVLLTRDRNCQLIFRNQRRLCLGTRKIQDLTHTKEISKKQKLKIGSMLTRKKTMARSSSYQVSSVTVTLLSVLFVIFITQQTTTLLRTPLIVVSLAFVPPLPPPPSSLKRVSCRKFTSAAKRSTTQLCMGLLDDLFQIGNDKNNNKNNDDYTLQILGEVGSGSYGTVHLCKLVMGNVDKDSDGDNDESARYQYKIAKRAYTQAEIHSQFMATTTKMTEEQRQRVTEKAERCRYYLDVERHCLEKLSKRKENCQQQQKSGGGSSLPVTREQAQQHVPNLIGTFTDNGEDKNSWLVFDIIEDGSNSITGVANKPEPAKSLADILVLDWADQHHQTQDDDDGTSQQQHTSHHHLYALQQALGMDEKHSTFGDTLDRVLIELLRAISDVNDANVVHRDVKPGNCLVTPDNGIVLIDFGSAADMDPPTDQVKTFSAALSKALGGNGGRVGLEDDNRVSLSPIYAAPELFVRWDRAPLNFDSFSTALVFTQLLFNLLDEVAEASYRQQLEDCQFRLDSVLQRLLADELQPDGLEDAVMYLGERPGLFALLRDMLQIDPEKRASTADALQRATKILQERVDNGKVSSSTPASIEEADGKFFAGVMASFEECELPATTVPEETATATIAAASSSKTKPSLALPRPLQYVATFSGSKPLGLLLFEFERESEEDDDYEDLNEEDVKAWKEATAKAQPGEVYVRGIVEGGQADSIGVFEVGDRLMGIGEFPFIAEGFATAVEMLERQPPSSRTVRLHFDRKSAIGGRTAREYERNTPHLAKVVAEGAWSAQGRRKAQEDRFILHEVHDGQNAALLAGVFDGHGGDAASTTLSQLLPSLFSVELANVLKKDSSNSANNGKAKSSDLREAIMSAYEITCNTYRSGCDENGECVADYDPREGIVLAGTGATDLVAGSTVAASVLSVAEDGADELTVLNCGDSRTLVVGRPRGGSPKDSVVYFSTRDHSPSCELEQERLRKGESKGYSQPKCTMSRWRMKVGDYQYALSRSLEGTFATSKGIVSDPDISIVNLKEMLAEREFGCVLILATDGLFEVIDNEEAGRDVLKWREAGLSAEEVAKRLCLEAVDKGSPDNVSAVILYLD